MWLPERGLAELSACTLLSSGYINDLQKQSLDTTRRRLQEVENESERIKDEAGAELARLQTEVETERIGREEADRKTEELEVKVDDFWYCAVAQLWGVIALPLDIRKPDL